MPTIVEGDKNTFDSKIMIINSSIEWKSSIDWFILKNEWTKNKIDAFNFETVNYYYDYSIQQTNKFELYLFAIDCCEFRLFSLTAITPFQFTALHHPACERANSFYFHCFHNANDRIDNVQLFSLFISQNRRTQRLWFLCFSSLFPFIDRLQYEWIFFCQ